MQNPTCIVLIPYYKNDLSDCEKYSLASALKVFEKQKLCLICPHNIKLPDLPEQLQVIRFDDKYFQSLRGYNQLMLSYFFYERFLNYDYILIYQLDALVFKDELTYWCSLGYDYYGAPWNIKTWKFKYFNLFGLLNYKVGNGGFSLRKTNTFYKMAKRIKRIKGLIKFGEDIFWCNFGRALVSNFKVLDYKNAIRFAFESNPEELYAVNHNQLPFGCHAFEKNNLQFWKEVLPALTDKGETD